MNIRVCFNVLLVRFGIRQILPSDYINAIPVAESSEPMVELPDGIIDKTDGKVIVGRKGMIERLTTAARIVSEQGYRLHIFQTYRSPQEQAEPIHRTAVRIIHLPSSAMSMTDPALNALRVSKWMEKY